MNYQALKSMIDGLIQSYKCPSCGQTINESSIEIVGAAGSNVNLDIECPSCKKHSMVKSQIIQMNLSDIANIKNNVIKNQQIKNVRKAQVIKDKEITSLSQDLKEKKLNVSDLFKN